MQKTTPAKLFQAGRGDARRCGDRGLGDPPSIEINQHIRAGSALLRFVAGCCVAPNISQNPGAREPPVEPAAESSWRAS